jgi:acyl transferase domain-containing protein/NAD(P)-dependent dehydrogenase (short-subunit alcohol dehydrogenase family)
MMDDSPENGFPGSAAIEGTLERDAEALPRLGGTGARSRSRGSASVAIIGVGCALPGANDVEGFWRNLMDLRELICEIPASRWDWRLYYDPDPSARDKISSRWGGFIDPMPFDPVRYGIPPVALGSISTAQLIALEVTLRALRHAGFGDAIADERVRERTAVVFGTGNTADIEQLYAARTALPLLLGDVLGEVRSRLPEWTEESYPGILPNVVAGRVANRFDLGGPNLTVDAACASSLAALDLAVRELEEERSDLVIAGGIDFEQTPQAFTAFSKTRALSPRGRARVFDEGADGIVISEGAVVMVLKRLADAERDQDRILAVIRSVAGSSDGRGMGLTAPRSVGQRRALDRAYDLAGFSPGVLGLYEAHGTGTLVGDAVEVETIDRALRDAGAGVRSCVLGSAKALFGHTRGCAGMVGLLKAALSLYHKVLPPHPRLERPLARLRDPGSPISLLTEPRPWLRGPGKKSNSPRRAGLSAFGFGGTNYHAVLEEYRGPSLDPVPPLGGRVWPAELFVFAAADRNSLIALLNRTVHAVDQLVAANSMPGDGSVWRLADLALACASGARGPERAALVVSSFEELRHEIEGVRDHLTTGTRLPAGAHVGSNVDRGDLAFLFPGQGAQYPGMGGELALFFTELRDALERADALCAAPLSPLLLPPAALSENEQKEQSKALADTAVAQPAIGAVSLGMLGLARRMGLLPARVAGHSYGELVALYAAGVVSEDDLLLVSEARARLMSDVGTEAGGMAAVALPLEQATTYVQATGITVANHNAPRQVVLSGPVARLEPVLERLKSDGHGCQRLAVSSGFHSPMMSPARPRFEAMLGTIRIHPPKLPVHRGRDGRPYPDDPKAIRLVLSEHMERRVDFVAQVEALYAAGARTFLELGPGQVLAGLVGRILADRPHVVLSADGGLRNWLAVLARLIVLGFPVQSTALFEGRSLRAIDLHHLPAPAGEMPGWLVDGGRVWRRGETTPLGGSTPLLNLDTVATIESSLVVSPIPTPIAANTADPLLVAYREYEATMRSFLEQQERIFMTLIDHREPEPVRNIPSTHSSDDGPTHQLVATEVRLVPEPSGAGVDRSRLTEMLFTGIIDRTGYPREALEPHLDFEAELGIDSIKRVEIINDVVRQLPEEVAGQLQFALDRLSRARSVNDLVEAMLQDGSSASATVVAGIATFERPATSTPDHCPRFITRAVPSELIESDSASLSGLHLVTKDRLGVADRVAQRLRALGATVEMVRLDDLEGESLEAQVARWRQDQGPVRGILHLAPLGEVDGDTLADWRRSTAVVTKRLFRLLQLCAGDFQSAGQPVRVLAAARSGTEGDETAAPDSLAAGGLHGLLRVLECEYSGVVSSVVEFDSAATFVELEPGIVNEFLAGGRDTEVRYREGCRLAISVSTAPHDTSAPERDWRPGADSVVLATGGARGITAHLCREIAAAGVRLIVVGRSPMQDVDASTEDRERRENLESFRQAGADVEYVGLDVRDEAQFGELIDSLYERFQKIDAVLHGAGLIEDQSFAKKGEASFSRVFDTKVDSTWILYRRLRPDTLKWIVLFGSVSGRFGNQGQADYAAANETVNTLAKEMDAQWPSTRVVTINWGPWSGAGMASGVAGRLLESRGCVLITPQAGRRFFAEELAHGCKGDVQVVAGDGFWRADSDQSLGSLIGVTLYLMTRQGPAHAPKGRQLSESMH